VFRHIAINIKGMINFLTFKHPLIKMVNDYRKHLHHNTNQIAEDHRMKLRVEKTALIQVLQKIYSITEKKTGLPILSNALVKTSEHQTVELSATDLELSVWTQVEATVEEPGATTVSARKLLDIVREVPQEYVTLESLPNYRLSITAGRSHFELPTIAPEDFPHVNLYEGIDLSSCDVGVLTKALTKTMYGIPAEEDPFSIAGLYWHPVEDGQMRFVSSDGHRLAYYQVPERALPALAVGDGVIIPRKGVQEILRILEKESEASLGLHENCLIVKTSNTLLSVQLLEGEFPEYQVIIPEERPFSFSIESDVLFHALKRVAVLTNQKWRHVRFIVSEGTLELESGNPEGGNANDLLDIDYRGETFSVAFNVRYILEAIQAVESPQIRFEWVDEFHGGVFLGTEDGGYLGLIMPMVI
jgi:DNA polymerase III subunit beta